MNDFTEVLKEFFEDNKETYYLLTNRVDYNKILRVDDQGAEYLNALDFILKNTGEVEDFVSYGDEIRFETEDDQYSLIAYDSGLVSI